MPKHAHIFTEVNKGGGWLALSGRIKEEWVAKDYTRYSHQKHDCNRKIFILEIHITQDLKIQNLCCIEKMGKEILKKNIKWK